MLIKEYRIVMPVSVQEYQIGQLFTMAHVSLNETGGGEGVEVIRNEPFDDFPLLDGQYDRGQYTFKKFYLASKVPAYIRMLIPRKSMEVCEEAWNAFPYCRTVLTNPGYMKENFIIVVQTLHLPGKGDIFNPHRLSPEKLSQREVIMIDIANDPICPADYKADEDPTLFQSARTEHGPLKGDWKNNCTPVMTCYKLVTVEFKWFGFQNRVENFLQKVQRRLFTNFHRQVFCWMDRWEGLTMDNIRALEDSVQEQLDRARAVGELQGMRATE